MAGANPQLLSGGHFEAEWRVKIKNYISNTSVLRGLDHFITSPDTPVCWIFCVNIWYYRFQFSLDRPIPTQIKVLIIFPIRCKTYFKEEISLELRRFSAFGSRHATACSWPKNFCKKLPKIFFTKGPPFVNFTKSHKKWWFFGLIKKVCPLLNPLKLCFKASLIS